jgi:hypothetical protein
MSLRSLARHAGGIANLKEDNLKGLFINKLNFNFTLASSVSGRRGSRAGHLDQRRPGNQHGHPCANKGARQQEPHQLSHEHEGNSIAQHSATPRGSNRPD